MKIECNKDLLNRMLDDFFIATGIHINFADCDCKVLQPRQECSTPYCRAIRSTPEGECRCNASDADLLFRCTESRCMEYHVCHAGLTDVAVPIYHGTELLGSIIFGEIRTRKDYCGDPALKELYDALPIHTEKEIRAFSSVAEMLARYVLLENVLHPAYRRGLDEAIAFIEAHLSEPLSVQTISKNTYVSKTSLYDAFHRQFGCTVNEYVNGRRLERSRELLLRTSKSVDTIAQEVGFSGAPYYSALFKKKYGLSPLRYRQSKKD